MAGGIGFAVGDLVHDENGSIATVKYIGPVATSKKQTTVWVGVEWKASGRGKHDGAVVDSSGTVHRYFQCADGQGSFLKPSKLHGGTDFFEAVREKYQPDLDISATLSKASLDEKSSKELNSGSSEQQDEKDGLRWGNGETLDIEPVGMDQIRSKQQLFNLSHVSIPFLGVSHCNKISREFIRKFCPNIKSLNMSDNVFTSWEDVASITAELAGLIHLDVSRNPLVSLPSNPITPLPNVIKANPFSTIKELVLVGTGTGISQIQRLDFQGLLPQLEQLFMGKNEISSLDPIADVKSKEVAHTKGTYAEWAQAQIVENDRKGFTPSAFLTGFANLTVLDLSDNNISSWSEVWRACRLPKLKVLNVSGNPVEEIFYDEEQLTQEHTPEEKEVVGEDVKMNSKLEDERRAAVEEFLKIQKGNESTPEVDSTTSPPTAPDSLSEEDQPKRGIMMSNGFVIPIPEKLERAKANPSRIFKGDGTKGGARPFLALRVVNLSRTKICSWASFDALNCYPKLMELRAKDVPLFESLNSGIVRQTLIARIKHLEKLNGSEVRLRERSDAELLYVKRCAMDESRQKDSVLFNQTHPRFKELVEMHGEPVMSTAGAGNGDGSLGSSTMSVTIKTFDPRTCTVPPAVKRLPASMTVSALKVLCQRIFGVDVSLQKLFYRENKKDFGHPIELDEDSSQLVYFGVQNGGEIIIEAVDPQQEQLKREKREKQEQQRLRQEEERLAKETARNRAQRIAKVTAGE